MGSGFTIAGVAALGLASIGVEVDPEYLEMAAKRSRSSPAMARSQDFVASAELPHGTVPWGLL